MLKVVILDLTHGRLQLYVETTAHLHSLLTSFYLSWSSVFKTPNSVSSTWANAQFHAGHLNK